MVEISPITQDSLRHSKEKQTAAATTHPCLRLLYPRILEPQINSKSLVTPIQTRKACAASLYHIIWLFVLSKPDCQLMATCHLHTGVIKTLFSSLNKRLTKKNRKKKFGLELCAYPPRALVSGCCGCSCDVWTSIRGHCSIQDRTNHPPRLSMVSAELVCM